MDVFRVILILLVEITLPLESVSYFDVRIQKNFLFEISSNLESALTPRNWLARDFLMNFKKKWSKIVLKLSENDIKTVIFDGFLSFVAPE